jgi:hypothetical protein
LLWSRPPRAAQPTGVLYQHHLLLNRFGYRGLLA